MKHHDSAQWCLYGAYCHCATLPFSSHKLNKIFCWLRLVHGCHEFKLFAFVCVSADKFIFIFFCLLFLVTKCESGTNRCQRRYTQQNRAYCSQKHAVLWQVFLWMSASSWSSQWPKIIFRFSISKRWCSRCLSSTLQSFLVASKNLLRSHRFENNRQKTIAAYTQLEQNASILWMRLNDFIRSARRRCSIHSL